MLLVGQKGLCFNTDSDLFFNVSKETQAKRVCARCYYKESCLKQALDAKYDYGIWGGTNWKERLKMLGINPENASRRARIYECP